MTQAFKNLYTRRLQKKAVSMEFLAIENNLVRITLISFKINDNTATLRFFFIY